MKLLDLSMDGACIEKISLHLF